VQHGTVSTTPTDLDSAGVSADVRRVVTARAIRGFADGFVSVLLALYLTNLGFSPTEVGAIVTGTLLGSAALTLAFGMTAHRIELRSLLVAATVVMVGTGLGFAGFTTFWPLLVVAVVGTLNPSSGDVSVFLPTEQALVADHVPSTRRVHVFSVYNLAAIFAAALGALVSGVPNLVARHTSLDLLDAQRLSFLGYALAGVVLFVIYRGLRHDHDALPHVSHDAQRRVLDSSRRIVLELSALFSLDSAGGGFAVTSILVLWLHLHHGHGVLRRRAPRGDLTARRAVAGGAYRSRPHHVVHPHPGERTARGGRVCADEWARDRVPPRARAPLADGRAGAAVVRDGRGPGR
jgi:MFS family permease